MTVRDRFFHHHGVGGRLTHFRATQRVSIGFVLPSAPPLRAFFRRASLRLFPPRPCARAPRAFRDTFELRTLLSEVFGLAGETEIGL
jgi:hypothetical protein